MPFNRVPDEQCHDLCMYKNMEKMVLLSCLSQRTTPSQLSHLLRDSVGMLLLGNAREGPWFAETVDGFNLIGEDNPSYHFFI